MKVIDLLNKIANNEEKPKIIKIGTQVWHYNYDLDDYMSNNSGYYLMNHYNMLKCLNYEVEIIGKEKKIPEKLNEELASSDDMLYKINEIIDYIKSKGE